MAAAAKQTKSGNGRRRRKKEVEPASRGLEAKRLASAAPPAKLETLSAAIEEDHGAVLGVFRDPLGGNWQILAGIPIDRVEPTPYQRDLSDTHVKRLTAAIDKLDRYLDPVIAVRTDEGRYWTPNGHHRVAAVRALGGKSIVALVVPEVEVAHRILLLNTEKAHNLRERALEVSRLAEALAELDPRPEREFEAEFEEPSLVTLGFCYAQRGRFAGGAFHPVLKRVEKFLASKLPNALETRRARAAKLLELEDVVNEQVKALKERGFESPYLKAFVVARINPLRFQRGAKAEWDETIDTMLASARRFDAGKIRPDQVARTGGPPEE
jgi:ParB family chromosome partitioning protein